METYAEYAARIKAQADSQSAAAAGVVVGSSDRNPDEVAGDMRLSQDYAKTTGKTAPPLPMVAENRSVFQQEIDSKRTATTLQGNPALSEWLRNPDNAAIAKDSVEELSWFERTENAPWRVPVEEASPSEDREFYERLGAAFGPGVMIDEVTPSADAPSEPDPFDGGGFENLLARRIQQAAQGLGTAVAGLPEGIAVTGAILDQRMRKWIEANPDKAADAVDGRIDMITAIEESLKDVDISEEERSFLQQNLDDMLEGIEVLEGRAPVALASEANGMKQGAAIKQQFADLFGTADERDQSIWGKVAQGAGTLTGFMASGMMPGKYLPYVTGAILGAGINGSQVYKEAIKAGATEEVALRASTWALAVGASEMIPINRALHRLPSGFAPGAFGRILGAIFEEAAQEGGSQIANNLIASSYYDEKRGWSEGVTEAMIIGSILGGGLRGTTEATTAIFNKQEQRAGKAKATEDRLKVFMDMALASKVRERSPEAFRNFIDRSAGGKTLYIPAKAFDEYFQSEGIDPDVMIGQLTGVDPEQVAQARAMEGDIAIPTATFAANLAGSEHDAFLLKNSKFDPEDMTGVDAEEWQKNKGTLLEEAKLQTEDIKALAAVETEASQSVFDTMTQRFVGADADIGTAKKEALLYQKFYEARAIRSGRTVSAVLEAYPLPQIRGASQQAAAKADAATLNQPANIPQYPIAPKSEWYGEANFADQGGAMVQMSPDEYLASVRPLTMGEESRENIDLLKEHMTSGKTLDPLKIFDGGKEDGRHRAYAAKELGIEQVPVVVFGDQVKKFNKGSFDRSSPNMLNQSAAPDENAAQSLDDGQEISEEIDATVTLGATNAMSQGKVWATGRDLKLAIQARLKAAQEAAGVDVSVPNVASLAYLTRVGTKDALVALEQNPSAIGWYDEKTRQALALMALIHPEIATDENARFAFTWGLAVTSNGLKVGKNFELADLVYRRYKADGKMPSDLTAGQAQSAINESLELFNDLSKEWGMEDLRKFMQTNFTVKEISSIGKDLKPSGEFAATSVMGSAILGPKIGNGFFSNLYGNFDALTMDRWLIRTWGRWTGTLIMLNEPQIIATRKRLRSAITGVNAQDLGDKLRSVVKVSTNKKTGVTTSNAIKPKDRDGLLAALEAANTEGATDQQIDDLAIVIGKASMEPKFRSAMNETPGGEEVRKSGNALAKYNDGQKEAPAGPAERDFIRNVFGQMLAELRTQPEYADLQMADLQAVLWYAEKRLYETAKEDVVAGDDVSGYEDDEAPDYANAAAGIARANGVPESKIKAAFKRESKDGRAAAARRRDGGTKSETGSGQQAKVAGFTRKEKREFVQTRAIHRVRSARGSDAAAWSYGRESAGDGGKVRVLKDLGVTFTAEWKAGRSLGAAFRANGIATPEFYELESGDQKNATAFAGAISAGRDTLGNMGKAVYIYPAEDYAGLRLFLTKDGRAGFAIKPDGDIVSVFSSAGTGAGRAIMETAIAAGGRKLDAFDTILPDFYAAHGFKGAARLTWADDQSPDGWDKAAFAEFNGGEPDVVFMVYDPEHFTGYDKKATPLKKGENNYGAALRAQAKAMTAVSNAPAPAPAAEAPAGRSYSQTLLTPPTPEITESEAFKAWFGTSQVTGGDGKPLVVFHGSERAGFTVFDTAGANKTRGTGAFFTDEERNAITYSGTRKDVDFPSGAEALKDPSKYGFDVTEYDGVVYINDPDGNEVIAEGASDVSDTDAIANFMEPMIDDWLTSDRFGEDKGNYSVYLKLQNPMIYDAGGKNWQELGGEEAYRVMDENGDAVEDFYRQEDADDFIANSDEEGLTVEKTDIPGDLTTDMIVRDAREYGEYDGVIFKNIVDEGGHGHGYGIESTVYVVFEPNQIKSVQNVGTFSSKSPSILQQPTRGSIQVPAGGVSVGQTVINTFASADPTTVLHESGHFFLMILQEEAAKGEASASKDYDALKSWWLSNAADVAKDASATGTVVTANDVEHALILGTSGDAAIDRAIDVGMQEQFARGFEKYLMEGVAPSSELRGIFFAMRSWLQSVYQSLASLNVTVTPEVRAVFDRMIATDDEITKAKQREADLGPLFRSAADMGLTPEEFEQYRVLALEAEEEVTATLTAEVMAPIRRQTEKWYRDEKAKLVAQLTEEKRAMPIYRAIQEMRFGKTFEGDDTPGIKMNRKVIEKHYGGPTTINLLPGSTKAGSGHRYAVFATGDGGMHPDVIAEMYGFGTGRELIGALVNTPPLEQTVQEEAETTMQQRHGDVLKDGRIEQAAMDALKGDKKALLIARELSALNAKLAASGPLKRSMMAPKVTQFREMAKRTLERMAVGDARATPRYVAAARKAAEEAFKALGKGDVRAAIDAKRRHLLAHMLYMEARKIDAEIDKVVTKIGKLDRPDKKLGKGVSIDHARAARAIAAKFGLASPDSSFDFDMWLAQLQQDDPATAAVMAHAIQTYTQNAKPFKQLTVGEFRAVADAIANMLAAGKAAKSIEIEGQTVDRDAAVAELIAVLETRGIKENPALKAKLTNAKKMGKAALSMLSGLRRVEAWARDMDDGGQGVYTRYIVRPIMDAIGLYRDARADKLAKLLEIIKPLRKDALNSGAIPAQELDYKFTNKAELLHALLHTGNDSNKEKLLMGRKWSTGLSGQQQKVSPTGKLSVDRAGNPIMDRGRVDTTQWDSFIGRMVAEGVLTKADYDAVQKIWDLMEELKRPAQATHRKIHGFYFPEVEATSLVTPFGTYRGGYVPAIADLDASNDGQIRADQAAMDAQQTSFMFPTTGAGFTKSRVVNYTTPLALDLMQLPAHMDKVLRFTHLEPAIRQTAGLVSARPLREAMDGYDQSLINSMLAPWLQRTAQQAVEAKPATSAGRALSNILRTMRRRVGINTMFANLVNTAQQVTGFFPALALVKPSLMAAALSRYVTGGAPVMRGEVMAQSNFMRERLGNAARESQRLIEEAVVLPTTSGEINAWVGKHGYFLQQAVQNIMDPIIWHAAFDQAIGKGMSDADAIFEADSVIRRSIGDFGPENLSLYETGNAFQRTFTMFYSYFNGQANLLGGEAQTIIRTMGWNGAPRLFFLYLMVLAAPAIVGDMIVQAFRGELGDEDEDGYADEIASTLLGSQLRYVTAMVPFVGQITMAIINNTNDKMYDDRLASTPVISTMERAAKAPYSIGKAVFDDGDAKKAVQDGMAAFALLTGIPMGQLSKMAGYGIDVATGKAQPEGAVDVGQGLSSGRDGTIK